MNQCQTPDDYPNNSQSRVHHNALSEGLARYLKPEQLAALRNTNVGIAGVGGLGSNVAFMLARSGIRNFTLADFDLVEPSNLNRQFFFPDQVGKLKVTALAELLLRLEPNLSLTLIPERLTPENINQKFSTCRVIVEALDKATEKAMCYRAFKNTSRFYAGASGLAGWGDKSLYYRRLSPQAVMVGDFTTETNTANPPLAPRVIQAAAMQANAVISHILNSL